MDRNQALTLLIEEAGCGGLQFPTHTNAAMKLRRLLDDPDCHLDAAAKLIEADPLLSAQIVAMANSIAFNSSGREIDNVRNAASRLGFATLRTLAMARLTRQMAGDAVTPEASRITTQLWQHSAHVGALARLIARRISGQNPEAALFAGLVHEIGGFYLVARSSAYPSLLDAQAPENTQPGGNVDRIAVEHELGLAILRQLAVPAMIVEAVEHCAQGYLAMPPRSLGDTVLLADYLAPVASPLLPADAQQTAALDFSLPEGTLLELLEESSDEVDSLARALDH